MSCDSGTGCSSQETGTCSGSHETASPSGVGTSVRLVCRLCGVEFGNRWSRNVHMKEVHPGIRMKLYNQDRKRQRGAHVEGGGGDVDREGAGLAEMHAGASEEVARSEAVSDQRLNPEDDVVGQHGAGHSPRRTSCGEAEVRWNPRTC